MKRAKPPERPQVKEATKPPKCTTCDDTGIAAYPMRLCGDCDAGKEKPS